MYYHTAILLLFRPFLKATLTNSEIVPREVCRKAANMICDIWSEHRRLYNLSGIYMFQVHCLLTACTIHIVNVPALSATSYLTDACNTLQDLISRNEWARSSLVILRSLVKRWDRVLPQEAEEALYRNQFEEDPLNRQLNTDDSRPDEKSMSSAYSNYVATADLTFQAEAKPGSVNDSASSRNSSMSAPPHAQFSSPHGTPIKRSSIGTPGPEIVTTGKRQRLVMPLHMAVGGTESPSSASAQNVIQSPTNYLYAPLDDQPAPLLAPVHTESNRHSPSQQDSSNPAGGSKDDIVGVANELDGLSFGDDWRDPFMGYGGDGGNIDRPR